MFRSLCFRCTISQYELRSVHQRLPITGIERICPKLLISSLSAGRSSSSLTKDYTSKRIDKKGKDDDNNDKTHSISLLYQRNPNRNALPRASFLVSSLNSIYWVWYVLDFIPAVNASPINDIHINQYYGLGGLALSILIQAAFTLYPSSLVSKIAYKTSTDSTSTSTSTSTSASTRINTNNTNASQQRHQQGEVLLWMHTLPLLKPSSIPLIFPLGEISMDKVSDDTHRILKELGGDLGKYQGHLSLKHGNSNNRYIMNTPLLVEIRESSEIYDSQKMLEVLLPLGRGLKSESHYNKNDRDEGHSNSNNIGNGIDSNMVYRRSTSNVKFSKRKKTKHRQK